MSGLPRRHTLKLVLALGLATGLFAITGCSSGTSTPASSLRPDSSTVEQNIVYRSIDGTDLELDACLPAASSTPSPALLLVHGGSFEAGGRGDLLSICKSSAASGVAAFTIDYRLLPANFFPAQVDDATAAVKWLADPAQVARFSIDPARIGVLGSSAGAIIAQSLATGYGEEKPLVKMAVSLSGASDLTPAGLTLGTPAADEQKIVLAYLGCTSFETCSDAEAASPLYSVSAGTAPMLLLNGSSEIVPSQQTAAMKAALDSQGVANTVQIVPGSKHGSQLVSSATTAVIAKFISEHL